MIVTCPECDTSFQLDESRIPKKGIRVRCSRCKHAFHLAHPSVSASEAVDEVVQEAVTNEAAPPPAPTADLGDPGASATAAPRSEINNEDAAEWEFNQDIPSTDDDRGSDGGELFDTGFDRDAPSGLDLATDAAAEASPPDPAPAPEPAAAAPVADAAADTPPGLQADAGLDIDAGLGVETGSAADAPASDGEASAFGSVDDFSSLMDDDPIDAIGAPQADETADELRAQAAEASATYAGEGQADDLGDPEKWDFFDGAAPPETQAPSPQKVALGRIGQLSGTSSAAEDLADDWSPGPVADVAEKGRVALLLESAGRIVGWTVVIVGFTLGVVSGLWTTAESFVAGERVTQVGPLEAVDMRAQWVDTARAGRLLVVSGGLRNPAPRPVVIPGALEIALLDRMGAPLGLPSVSAGVALSERQLRELPAEVLTRVRAQAAAQLQSASIPSGGLLPFQVLIFDAPASGLRFEARLAESGQLSLPEPRPEAQALEVEEVASEEGEGAMELVLDPLESETGRAVEEAASAPSPTRVAPDTGAPPAAPGYDDPYGEDAGMGLQDL